VAAVVVGVAAVVVGLVVVAAVVVEPAGVSQPIPSRDVAVVQSLSRR
jgi:hypothetical protein